MPPHLLRCQGIAVGNYSFILGRLEAGAPSTFDQLGSSTSGLFFTDIQNHFFTLIILAVKGVAKEQGICIFRGNSDEDPAEEVMCLKLMRDDRVAGIILSPTLKTSNSFIEITNSNLPIAAIDRCVPA